MSSAQLGSFIWLVLATVCLLAREPLWEAGLCFIMAALSDVVHTLRQIRDLLSQIRNRI